MSKLKAIFAAATAAAALAATALSAGAQTASITMLDAGYGISGGVSFAPDGITMNTSTLGELADLYDTIDFTISAADLGGRDDLLFQVYVAADNWAIWANAGETPAIEQAGTEYAFSLNVDDIAAEYGADKVICDMGFQILSGTAGDVDVDYNVVFNAGGAAAESGTAAESGAPAENKGNPDTGVEGVGAIAAAALAAGGMMAFSRKNRR